MEPAASGQSTGAYRMAKEQTVSERIKELEEQNAKLTAKLQTRQTLTLKVSEKGALSLYGLGRFPVTLYVGQWEKVLGHVEAIKAFIKEAGDKLSRKE